MTTIDGFVARRPGEISEAGIGRFIKSMLVFDRTITISRSHEKYVVAVDDGDETVTFTSDSLERALDSARGYFEY